MEVKTSPSAQRSAVPTPTQQKKTPAAALFEKYATVRLQPFLPLQIHQPASLFLFSLERAPASRIAWCPTPPKRPRTFSLPLSNTRYRTVRGILLPLCRIFLVPPDTKRSVGTL
jgi:hypothetical protein